MSFELIKLKLFPETIAEATADIIAVETSAYEKYLLPKYKRNYNLFGVISIFNSNFFFLLFRLSTNRSEFACSTLDEKTIKELL